MPFVSQKGCHFKTSKYFAEVPRSHLEMNFNRSIGLMCATQRSVARECSTLLPRMNSENVLEHCVAIPSKKSLRNIP